MANLYVEPEKFRSCITQTNGAAQSLHSLLGKVDNICENLRYKIAGREAIAARLREVGEQIAREEKGLRTLGSGMNQILATYQKVENMNLAALIAEAVDADAVGNGSSAPSGKELLATSDQEKDRYINQFEKENPKQAKQLDKFLTGGENNQLTEEDIRNIKYLIYNAKEPYRSAYLNSLSKFKMENVDTNDGSAYYKNWVHSLYYSYPESFDTDPRGAYTTFFHECGHAIDDLSEEAKWLGKDTEKFSIYSDTMGKNVTLRETIEYDVYYNTENPHSMTSIANQIISNGETGDKGNIENVIAALKSGTSKGLTKDDLMLYNAVKNEHMRTTTGNAAQFEAVSDVYGGVSGNELRNGYGHDPAYWNDKTKAGGELWAEYFSYNMSGAQENLQHLIEYFPESYKVLEAYAYEVAK